MSTKLNQKEIDEQLKKEAIEKSKQDKKKALRDDKIIQK